MDKKPRERNPSKVTLSAEFRAEKDHVVAVVWMGNSSIGIRFESPEHILAFCSELMVKAAEVWPDNPLIKELED